ncbi:MAG TPA: hypothetical protein VNT22_05145 [Baekduia sp.]|nr:hypothetical protein [Baekduia sp.]
MTWVESGSRNFAARHEEDDTDDVSEVLELLEATRDQVSPAFARMPGTVHVVAHGSDLALGLAQPMVPVMRRLTSPAARRYVVGWNEHDTIHVLAPRLLEARMTNQQDSKQLGMLAPASLYAQIVVGFNSPQLPPPFTPRTFRNALRWSWLYFGAGQYLSGQTQQMRSPLIRRLREGSQPSFPPSRRDAPLLGGTVVDMIGLELGDDAVVKLVTDIPNNGPRAALLDLFDGLSYEEIEAGWRRHLQRMTAV